mgnify:CR=1 FL=1
MDKPSQWARSHKPQVAAIAAAIIVVIVVAIAVASGAFATSAQQQGQDTRTVDVTLNVTADSGWDENSTPAIAHIEGGDVDFYHAVNPDAEGNKGTSTVALAEGDYTVSFVSPVNSDGSAFDVYDTGAPVDITVDADAETAPVVDCHMTRIPADQVTDEMLAHIIDQAKDAVETLKGEAGTGILDKLEGNVAQNPNASDETKQEAADADKEVDVNDEPARTTPPTTTDNNTDSQSSNTGNQSTSTGNSGSSSSQSSQPAHTHTWVNHTATRQVWVCNWVDVPDYSTQQVQTGTRFVFSEDGYTTTSLSDAKAHAVALVKQGYVGNYHTEAIYETQTVQTGSHKEDHGSYKTETYVDYVYCSSCGARQ